MRACVSVFSHRLQEFVHFCHDPVPASVQRRRARPCVRRGEVGGGGLHSGVSQRPRRQGHGLTGVCAGPSGLQSSSGAEAQCVYSSLEGDRRDIAGLLRGGGEGGGWGGLLIWGESTFHRDYKAGRNRRSNEPHEPTPTAFGSPDAALGCSMGASV